MSQGQAAAILNELQEIRKLLESQQSTMENAAAPAARPQQARVSVAGGHVLGRDDAPLTLVEFTDFQCPFCNRFATTTLEELKKAHIFTGTVRLVSRDLPLAMHPDAMAAASAARCAGEQEQYWLYRDVLFGNTDLSQAALVDHARNLGLAMPQFEACLTSNKYDTQIRQDMADANAVGLTGTPSFVLGKTSGDYVEGRVLIGAQPFSAFDLQIKALLADGQ